MPTADMVDNFTAKNMYGLSRRDSDRSLAASASSNALDEWDVDNPEQMEVSGEVMPVPYFSSLDMEYMCPFIFSSFSRLKLAFPLTTVMSMSHPLKTHRSMTKYLTF